MSVSGNIGFLGFGNMGAAIAEGILRKGVVPSARIHAYDPSDERQHDARRLGVEVAESGAALAATSDILVLAVKPQIMGEALRDIRESIRPGALLVSIAAGLPVAWLRKHGGEGKRIVRVMPNTPSLAGAGASAIALGPDCTAADQAAMEAVFGAVGMTVFVEEEQLHGVTALSGSGPAYFFRLVEALEVAAESEGLAPELARALAAQTLYGAGQLLHQTGEHASELRARVTSKGGTTEAALKAFGENGFDTAVQAGVRASAARSRELGSQLE